MGPTYRPVSAIVVDHLGPVGPQARDGDMQNASPPYFFPGKREAFVFLALYFSSPLIDIYYYLTFLWISCHLIIFCSNL
jgi:hypothetical protein